MTTPTLTAPPAKPSRADDPDSFADKADAFVAWLTTSYSELTAMITWIASSAAQVSSDSLTASQAATTATATAGASLFVSGFSYAQYAVVFSAVSGLSYRRKTAGSGATDPSSDTTNWWPLVAGGDVTQTATQTLINKTLTAPTVKGEKEGTFTITDGGSVDIDPANGAMQKWTLGASRTPTAASMVAGQSVLLKIAVGASYAVTWTTIAPVWVGGSAPTLPTSGFGLVTLWRDGDGFRASYGGALAS